ncbi:winged helix-turn-helix domain-containing protein [Pseudoalteromonas sp. SS15]|uniref:winged helix-turn-helix domain-containing protein n=1 Tax=Pseudoalteromonas sp. SS15 TaxID=3139393 RepID=UPI003BACEC62
MAEQYKIGEFLIDLSRNQITQDTKPQIIPPKALAVLTYLAKHQGKVISQDELLDNVWKGTVVSPNTLQRSIAQLRKALGDDGKEQTYIKTHAKQGYSLEQNVHWLTKEEQAIQFQKQDPADTLLGHVNKIGQCDDYEESINKPLLKNTYVLSLFTFLILVVISVYYFTAQPSKPFSIGQIRALTATDGKELASIYSPDGKYIIFHRYSEEECINDIWAKNLETQQEYKLSKNMDIYGQHRFSKDGKKIIVIRTVDCGEPVTQKKCYQLMSLDFEKALNAPQEMDLILECKNSEIRRPYWLNNGNIALMQKHTERWQLVSFESNEKHSKVLHSGFVYHYDYSPEQDLLAVTSIKEDSQYYIDIIKPNGELISSHPIHLPPEITGHRFIRPNFSPIENTLIFSTGRQLFSMTFDGEIQNISIPVDKPFSSPMFHPDGDRGLVIKGVYDTDIISVDLNDGSSSVISRSNTAENNAVYQPNGSYIAFESARSGEAQVWVTNHSITTQLSQLPTDSYVTGMKWSSDGKNILMSANSTLFNISLDKVQTPIKTSLPILALLHWDDNKNSALVFAQFNGVKKLAQVNLSSGVVQKLTDKRVNWATKTDTGAIVLTDHMGRFWVSSAIEYQSITALNMQGGDNKRFFIRDNKIYGINNLNQVWCYDIQTKDFETITTLTKNTENITDIKNNKLLVTKRQVANKEVVELLLVK